MTDRLMVMLEEVANAIGKTWRRCSHVNRGALGKPHVCDDGQFIDDDVYREETMEDCEGCQGAGYVLEVKQ